MQLHNLRGGRGGGNSGDVPYQYMNNNTISRDILPHSQMMRHAPHSQPHQLNHRMQSHPINIQQQHVSFDPTMNPHDHMVVQFSADHIGGSFTRLQDPNNTASARASETITNPYFHQTQTSGSTSNATPKPNGQYHRVLTTRGQDTHNRGVSQILDNTPMQQTRQPFSSVSGPNGAMPMPQLNQYRSQSANAVNNQSDKRQSGTVSANTVSANTNVSINNNNEQKENKKSNNLQPHTPDTPLTPSPSNIINIGQSDIPSNINDVQNQMAMGVSQLAHPNPYVNYSGDISAINIIPPHQARQSDEYNGITSYQPADAVYYNNGPTDDNAELIMALMNPQEYDQFDDQKINYQQQQHQQQQQ
eukprot:396718_1